MVFYISWISKGIKESVRQHTRFCLRTILESAISSYKLYRLYLCLSCVGLKIIYNLEIVFKTAKPQRKKRRCTALSFTAFSTGS